METLRPDGVRIASLSLGPVDAARTLVCLGGWAAGTPLWLPLAEELTGRGWRVVAMDHRGCGDSACAPALISRDRMLGDLDAVLAAHEVGGTVLLAGASQGALLGLHAEVSAPGRFAALVLLGGMARWPLDESTAAFARALTEDRAAALRRFAAACVPERDAAHLRPRLLRLLEATPQEPMLELLATLAGPGVDLAAVEAPVLVLAGALDAVVPVAHAEELTAGLPRARLQVLDGVGHFPGLTRPRTVAAELEAFLDAVS